MENCADIELEWLMARTSLTLRVTIGRKAAGGTAAGKTASGITSSALERRGWVVMEIFPLRPIAAVHRTVAERRDLVTARALRVLNAPASGRLGGLWPKEQTLRYRSATPTVARVS